MDSPVPFFENIWLADDDPDDRELFEDVLRQIMPSCHLTTFINGEELMKSLSPSNKPEILFLDLNMPCKNGYECLVEIRKRPELRNLLIVIYSSSAHMTDIQKSYVHKADLYMVKPFNSLHLRNALDSVLKMEWIENYPNERFYFINNRFVPFTA